MTDSSLDWLRFLKENMRCLLRLVEMLVQPLLVEGVQLCWSLSYVLLQHLSICTITVPQGSGKDSLTLLLLLLSS